LFSEVLQMIACDKIYHFTLLLNFW
jgi:hypothetical protein